MLIDEGYAEAVRIITENRPVLDNIARALIQVETLDGENLERVFNGEPPLEPGTPAETPPPLPESQPQRPALVPRLSPGAASSTT